MQLVGVKYFLHDYLMFNRFRKLTRSLFCKIIAKFRSLIGNLKSISVSFAWIHYCAYYIQGILRQKTSLYSLLCRITDFTSSPNAIRTEAKAGLKTIYKFIFPRFWFHTKNLSHPVRHSDSLGPRSSPDLYSTEED